MSSATATAYPMPKPEGLEGVVAASTALSHVFGEEGRLVYRGYDIHELAGKASFEEVAHLLWLGHLPDGRELDELHRKLGANRDLPDAVFAVLRALPADTAPMDALRTGISALGAAHRDLFDDTPDLEEAIALAARVPAILAAFFRLRQGLDPVPPRPDLNTAQSYLYQLFGSEPEPRHWQPLEVYLVLLADHGMNASTFTARVIASTASDLCSALTGAVGALKGPLHGGAPSKVLDMLNEIGSAENVEAWLTHALDTGQRLMGFGHRVYKAEDPRAEILRGLRRLERPRPGAGCQQPPDPPPVRVRRPHRPPFRPNRVPVTGGLRRRSDRSEAIGRSRGTRGSVVGLAPGERIGWVSGVLGPPLLVLAPVMPGDERLRGAEPRAGRVRGGDHVEASPPATAPPTCGVRRQRPPSRLDRRSGGHRIGHLDNQAGVRTAV